MKAVLCTAYGPPESLVYDKDAPDPSPGPGQVVIDVAAAGVNFPDLLMIGGLYQFKPAFPFSPGGEVAGVVRSVGQGVVAFRPGDPVIAVCGHGGFASQVVVDAGRLSPVPPGMDLVTAAGFTMTYATSYYALKDRAQLQKGETLLVLGAAGGVGLAAVQIGRALGAHVIAAASTDEKLALCQEHGAEAGVNYATEDLKARLRELTGGRGVDVVYDPVGGAHTEAALRSLAWEGRLLVVGFATGEIPKIPLNLVLLKGCQIVGVFWGQMTGKEAEKNRRNFEELSQLFAEGKIRPLVSRTYPLAEAAQALQDLAARRVTGKVCLVV